MSKLLGTMIVRTKCSIVKSDESLRAAADIPILELLYHCYHNLQDFCR